MQHNKELISSKLKKTFLKLLPYLIPVILISVVDLFIIAYSYKTFGLSTAYAMSLVAISSIVYIIISLYKQFSLRLNFKKKIFIDTLFIVLVVPIFINGFLLTLFWNNDTPGASVRTLIASEDAWLGFVGSLLGSLITMLALVYTLDQQERTRAEDKEIELLPLIAVGVIDYQENLTPLSNNLNVNLEIINVSNNHIKDCKILFSNLSCKMKFLTDETSPEGSFGNIDIELNEVEIEKFSLNNISINVLSAQSRLQFTLQIPIKLAKDEYILTNYELRYRCDIYYKNIIKSKSYKYFADIETTILVNGKVDKPIKHYITRVKEQDFEKNSFEN